MVPCRIGARRAGARRIGAGIAGLISASVLAGCGEGMAEDVIALHPIADSLVVPPGSGTLLRRIAPADGDPELASFARRLSTRQFVSEVGNDEGPEEEVLGRVVAAHLFSDGSVGILDQQASMLRIFNSEGTHRYSIGGEGDGPGELSFPQAVAEQLSGEVWLLDSTHLHKFKDEGGDLAFEERWPLESYTGRDLCTAADDIMVHIPMHLTRPDQSASVHPEVLFRYDAEGERKNSFGIPYKAYAERLVMDRMNRGSIACTEDGSVFLAYEGMNRLEKYDASSGTLLWHGEFEGIHIPRLQERLLEDQRTGVSYVAGDGPLVHNLLGVSGGQGSPIIVQFVRRMQEDIMAGIDQYEIETFAVSSASGESIYLGEGIPQILSLTEEHAVFHHEDPFPRVEVARLGEGAR